MDPKANIEEQRELAREILDLSEKLASVNENVFGGIVAKADRLAELVQSLDEWRLRGGFDPYV